MNLKPEQSSPELRPVQDSYSIKNTVNSRACSMGADYQRLFDVCRFGRTCPKGSPAMIPHGKPMERLMPIRAES